MQRWDKKWMRPGLAPGFCVVGGQGCGTWRLNKLFVAHYLTEVTYSRSTGENEQVSRSQQRGENKPFMT